MTAIFVDGLGRVLQTKKDAAIFQKDGAPDKEQMIVSGRVFFDALGRTTKAYYPVIDDSGEANRFIGDHDKPVPPTTTTYDVLNRALRVTLPDESITETEYGFGTDREGKLQFSTKTTDANGIATTQFTDVKGRVTAVKNAGNTWTSFVYNAMSEQVKATDPMGNSTISKYDWFGRRVSRIHPDAGETIYKYDLAGNLTELITANLSKTGGAIQYVYDHERLKKILYPNNPENNVLYEYGQAGDSHNRAGRIITQVDASGSQDFYYGPLGEVVKNVRTIVIPRFEDQTFVTEWKYDTWNRLTEMTYPDGEKVEYTYNVGGLLHSMRGKKKGTTYEYVTQLGYDKFEQRVFLAYGNGTKTTYEYEPKRRRLKNMVASTASGRAMMDNVYEYDAVNNILSLKNNAPVPTANLMGGSSEYSYEYDELYRLTDAVGNFKGANHEHQYTLKMACETFVEEHSNTNRTPYLFNGKELDEETGLYYYGARYYDPVTSVFLSIDPRSDEFVWQSPFAYAANNPVRYADINGEGPGDRVKKAKETVKSDTRKYGQVNGSAAYKDNLVDCSEFAREIAVADGYDPGRDTGAQSKYYKDKGEWITDIKDVKEGDFVFWKLKTEKDKEITHTGIVTEVGEDGKLSIVQSTRNGGGESINDKYKTNNKGDLWSGSKYESNFVGAGRPSDESDMI